MNAEDTLPPQRRADDARIAQLIGDVAELKSALAENNKTTEQVKDILTTFKTLFTVAKWVSVVAGGVAAVIASLKGGR